MNAIQVVLPESRGNAVGIGAERGQQTDLLGFSDINNRSGRLMETLDKIWRDDCLRCPATQGARTGEQ
jgi:hypothetical protein